MPNRIAERLGDESFAFRVKMGEYEIEITGKHQEVLDTIKELPNLMTGVHKAFETSKPRTTATLTVRKASAKEEKSTVKYPEILHTESCSKAILNVLATDWGKWRPRTVDELNEALKANGLDYPGRTRAGVLTSLVRKGKVRRWKTDDGYVYILAEKETLKLKGET